MATSKRFKDGDFGDEEPTIVDGAQLVDDENSTPEVPPLCLDCGRITFADDASTVSFPDDRCLHSTTQHETDGGAVPRWWWCCKNRRSVTFVPR